MEKSGTGSPAPSSSATKVRKNHTIKTEPVSSEEDEILTLKSFEVIYKIAGMLKTDSGGFGTILEKMLTLFDGKQSDEKELMKEVISNILEADTDELIFAKGYFQRILSQKKSKHVLTKESDLQEPPVTGILPQKESKYVLIKETDLKTPPVTVKCGGQLNTCHLNMLRQADGTWKKVAIKRAILPENDKFIEQEATILSQLNHENIIKFYGKLEAKPEIVLEFMDQFDLLEAIEKLNFTTGNLLQILEDVACGMEYLTEKQYLHRNLAYFNVFLNTKKQCKIGNFGFAVYVGNSNGVYVEEQLDVNVPPTFDDKPFYFFGSSCFIRISELAPETLNTNTFSTATDVWSMGLLCWDTFAFADRSMTVEKQLTARAHFSFGKTRLPRSQNCPVLLYQYITNDLLNPDPEKRPRFNAIRAKIKEIASKIRDRGKC